MAYTPPGHSTFGGVAFDIVGDDGGATLFADQTAYAAEDLHYSDTTFLQDLGRKSGEVALAVVVDTAGLAALRGKRGTQGTLTTASGEGRTATLLGVQAPRAFAAGYGTATLTFYV